MLTALESGVKGGKWFSLMDKVYSLRTLYAAFERVRRNKGSAGVDKQTIAMFEKKQAENLGKLARVLRTGAFEPQPVRRTWIDKPGSKDKRPLGIPTIRDRVVQTALRFVLEPIFERDFADCSFGFRPQRGCRDALRRVDRLLRRGYTWVVDADLKSYFDTIPHERLMARVETKVADGAVLALLRSYLKQGVMDGMKHWTPEEGTPQGAVISPLLSNIYLDPLDHALSAAGFEITRYADDFVIQCQSEAAAHAALDMVREWTAQAGLTLHPEKTHIVDATQKGGFDFLGYHFERGMQWPRKKSLKKIRTAIAMKTKRCNGKSIEETIELVNRSVRGWYGYFKYAKETTFKDLDGWIRMRLRSILRKRRGCRGRGRGSDHQRWPNSYFADRGLFSMVLAHETARQSVRR